VESTRREESLRCFEVARVRPCREHSSVALRGLLERGSKPPILQARGTQACWRVMSALAATSLRRGSLNRPSGSYPDGFIRSEFRAIVLQASQGVGSWRGPGLRSRAFELSKESPRVANFYVAFGTFVWNLTKLGQLNDCRGISVPIWAAVLTVLIGLYTNNIKIKNKRMHQLHTNPLDPRADVRAASLLSIGPYSTLPFPRPLFTILRRR
jgi:hypothetical protein